jgi:hypothetical protein
MDMDELALAVDERVLALPEGIDPARLFGVQVERDGAFDLLPLWSGVARELPPSVVPPGGLRAIALETGGWAAPMDEGRPSLHPLRRRVHNTTLVYGDGRDISALRYEDDPPLLLCGGVGIVPALLVGCWQRRLDARYAG